jgi:hypothetical protein
MAHEMTQEGKLLKMIYSVLHDSLLATATGNSATSSDNSTTISRTTTDTVDTTYTATTTGDQKKSNRSSESQSQGNQKRQRTHEPENEITKPPDLTDPNHQQQKSPDTEKTETQQTRAGEADEVQRQKSPTTPPRQTIHGDLVRRLGPPQDHSSYASREIYYRDDTHKYTKEIQQTKIRNR